MVCYHNCLCMVVVVIVLLDCQQVYQEVGNVLWDIANCADRHQPLDLSVNKPAKDFLRGKFEEW